MYFLFLNRYKREGINPSPKIKTIKIGDMCVDFYTYDVRER